MSRAEPDVRTAFAEAMRSLRARAPDVSDEMIARRASTTSAPSGRLVRIDPRRMGEWVAGRSVPRSFAPIAALVRLLHPDPGVEQALIGWRELWRAASQSTRHPARPDRRAVKADPAKGDVPGPDTPRAETASRAQEIVAAGEQNLRAVMVGRPPTAAAALRERPELAGRIDAAIADPAVSRVILTGMGGVGKSQLASAALHRAREQSSATVLVWVQASSRMSVSVTYARAWRALTAIGATGDLNAPLAPADDELSADLFLAWLQNPSATWLVILDDVADPGDLRGLWPPDCGTILVTTQRRDAAMLAGAGDVIEVGPFSAQEAAPVPTWCSAMSTRAT